MAEGDKRVELAYQISVATFKAQREWAAAQPWTWEAVAARLKEAARTLQAMPTDKPKGYRAMWPDVPHDARTAYGYYGDPLNLYKRERQMPDVRFTPEPGAIDRMDEALGWLHWLNKDERALVSAVSKGVRKNVIARNLKVHRTEIGRIHRQCCRAIARRLNREGE